MTTARVPGLRSSERLRSGGKPKKKREGLPSSQVGRVEKFTPQSFNVSCVGAALEASQAEKPTCSCRSRPALPRQLKTFGRPPEVEAHRPAKQASFGVRSERDFWLLDALSRGSAAKTLCSPPGLSLIPPPLSESPAGASQPSHLPARALFSLPFWAWRARHHLKLAFLDPEAKSSPERENPAQPAIGPGRCPWPGNPRKASS